jgi:DNA processing protein
VSGLALGIDGAAHRGALDAHGMTIGVLGCGIDVYYPREHLALQDRIAHDGLLLSEWLPGQPPLRHHFPHRNRIIAAMSTAVVVVEASEKSGEVKTAEHAVQQGIDVYVVPNALDLPNMQGNLALLRDGAQVFTESRDLLESTRLIGVGATIPRAADREAPPDDPLQRRVWTEVTHEARHVDAIANAAALPTTRVLVALLELELEGRVRQLPGSRFARVARREPRRVA